MRLCSSPEPKLNYSIVDGDPLKAYNDTLALLAGSFLKGLVMKIAKDSFIWRFKWHIAAVIYVVLILVILLVTFTDVFETSQENQIPQLVWLLGGAVVLVALIMILSKLLKVLEALRENGTKLEKVAGSLEKIRAGLSQVDQSARISETAKKIAFREADRQALRDAVFDKLQQKNFDATYEIIDEIAHLGGYKELAEQLRSEANKYRDASDQDRVNQVIEHIDNLLDDCQWAKASMLIERIIRDAPKSDKALAMRQKLVDKKEERKKILLNAWDDAVKRQATDRSLEILRELDMYLTPNEALALQEAATDIFRNKLHSLGVQFSLAVSGKQWVQALHTGQQIVRDFPNSKMAQEIRERIEVLKQKVEQHAN